MKNLFLKILIPEKIFMQKNLHFCVCEVKDDESETADVRGREGMGWDGGGTTNLNRSDAARLAVHTRSSRTNLTNEVIAVEQNAVASVKKWTRSEEHQQQRITSKV